MRSALNIVNLALIGVLIAAAVTVQARVETGEIAPISTLTR